MDHVLDAGDCFGEGKDVAGLQGVEQEKHDLIWQREKLRLLAGSLLVGGSVLDGDRPTRSSKRVIHVHVHVLVLRGRPLWSKAAPVAAEGIMIQVLITVAEPVASYAAPELCQVDSAIAVVLLDGVATEEAEKLYDDSLQSVRRGPAFGSVQHASTDVLTEHVWMLDTALDSDRRRMQRVVVVELDGEMQRVVLFGREYQASPADIGIVEMQMDVRIGVLLYLRYVVEKAALEGLGSSPGCSRRRHPEKLSLRVRSETRKTSFAIAFKWSGTLVNI